MLFLVLSTPAPTAPDAVQDRRKRYWPWIDALKAEGLARWVYPRAGRGAVVLFDVDSNETLHRLINEWANIVPAAFEVIPLIEADTAQAYLDHWEQD